MRLLKDIGSELDKAAKKNYWIGIEVQGTDYFGEFHTIDWKTYANYEVIEIKYEEPASEGPDKDMWIIVKEGNK